MSHYAQIDSKNKVIQVLDVETKPTEGVWIETSIDTWYGQHMLGGIPLRKNFGAVGFSYDSVRDAFISPKQFNSWVLNEDSCTWQPPVPYPAGDGRYYWNEATTSWTVID
jgi:hypothetical protein